MPAAPSAFSSAPLPEGDHLALALQLAAVVASLSQDVVSGSPLFARVPRSDRAHLVLRGLLCASASLPVKLGLTVEEVAAEVEAFARRLRSGEAEGRGQAVVAQLVAQASRPLDPWAGVEDDEKDTCVVCRGTGEKEGSECWTCGGSGRHEEARADYEDDDGQPDSRQEREDFAGDNDLGGYDGDLGGDC